jgi:hypothetical protein
MNTKTVSLRLFRNAKHIQQAREQIIRDEGKNHSTVLWKLGKEIVEHGILLEFLSTETLFAALFVVNRVTKVRPIIKGAERRKNQIQKELAKRDDVMTFRGTGKFRRTVEIRKNSWSTHIPIKRARAIGIKVPC